MLPVRGFSIQYRPPPRQGVAEENATVRAKEHEEARAGYPGQVKLILLSSSFGRKAEEMGFVEFVLCRYFYLFFPTCLHSPHTTLVF